MNIINTQLINNDSLLYELHPILITLSEIINKKPLSCYLLESYAQLNNIHSINRSDIDKKHFNLYQALLETIYLHLWYNFHNELHSFITYINNLINLLKKYINKSLKAEYLNFYN
jgi:hypothetical protein